MDPVAVTAGLAAAASACAAWRFRRCASRAEAETVALRDALRAERHAALHDPLTGLPNRRAFCELGGALVADPGRRLVAVMVDLDDFKRVNDTLGHAAGDEVLATLAGRFAAYADGNLAARLGGDEFAGLLATTTDAGGRPYPDPQELADVLADPVWVAGHTVRVTASIGMVPVREPTDLAQVLRDADAAMYRAKTIRCTATVYFADDRRSELIRPAGGHASR